MALFSFSKKQPIQQAPVEKKEEFVTSVNMTAGKDQFEFQPYVNPLVKVFGVYVNGTNNLFPNYINYIRTKSPLHSRILTFKRLLTVSNGYTIDDSLLDIGQKIALKQLTNQIDKCIDQVGDNYFASSNVYIKITWNSDNTKILKIESIPHEKIRVKEVDQHFCPMEYEYCYDWANVARFPRYTIAKFDQRNKECKEQLFHFEIKSDGQIIYNRPEWFAAMDWVEQNGMMGEYHTANMTNSVNPSGLIEFFKKPANREEEWKILNDINSSFAGARKAGRLMAIFNKDIDSAAKYTPLDANKLDKTFIVLSDTIQREICYAHGIDPQILGLKTPSALGNSVSLPEAFKIFNYSSIRPAQKDIEQIFNMFFSINGLPVKMVLNTATNIFES